MTEYRVEFTDCRGKTIVRPWVECDEATARRAAREAIGNMGFMHWPNVTVRKRETTESIMWTANRPEFINDHIPILERLEAARIAK